MKNNNFYQYELFIKTNILSFTKKISLRSLWQFTNLKKCDNSESFHFDMLRKNHFNHHQIQQAKNYHLVLPDCRLF